MNITIEIHDTEKNIKKAIAKGQNNRSIYKVTYKDIGTLNKDSNEDIVNAMPYINIDNIEIINIE